MIALFFALFGVGCALVGAFAGYRLAAHVTATAARRPVIMVDTRAIEAERERLGKLRLLAHQPRNEPTRAPS